MLAIGIALAITGCASQSLDAEHTQSIKRIALAGPENPKHYALAVGDLGTAIATGATTGPGATAGILAGSLAASGKARTLTEAMAFQRLELGDELAKEIDIRLSESGYNVVRASVQRRNPSELLDSYEGAAINADALLDVAIQKSGYERRVWGKVGPSLTVTARLVDLRSTRQLLARTYRYDMYSMTMGWIILRPPEKYGFDDARDVLAHPDVAAEGLRAAIPMIADDLAAQFKK